MAWPLAPFTFTSFWVWFFISSVEHKKIQHTQKYSIIPQNGYIFNFFIHSWFFYSFSSIKGDFIALECTYFFSTFVFLVFLRDRLWDFAITVTIIHCAITCAGKFNYFIPLN